MSNRTKTAIDKNMPIIQKWLNGIDDNNQKLTFTLSNVDMCFANAIRRTILSDIDVVCILSDKFERNQVSIETNTGRLHNEILKHRLSCIPIHFNGDRDDMDEFCKNYVLRVDCSNNDDKNEMKIVTTEDFKVFHKETADKYQIQVGKELFRFCSITKRYIDFSRLRPKISDTIPGEVLKFSANFSISNAKDNAMYNVVSKCTYSNTIDTVRAKKKRDELEAEHRSKGLSEAEIEFEKTNFDNLDAQRYFIENSFDFVIEGLDIFPNIKLLNLSCQTLIGKFNKIIEEIKEKKVPILRSETTMKNSFDIILDNEDYTIGKVIEYILYTNCYAVKNPTLNFCGFKKFHPHDAKSTIRIAFVADEDLNPAQLLKDACEHAIVIFEHIKLMVKE
jgi:DNA-directed RNA polymerase alpha subunit